WRNPRSESDQVVFAQAPRERPASYWLDALGRSFRREGWGSYAICVRRWMGGSNRPPRPGENLGFYGPGFLAHRAEGPFLPHPRAGRRFRGKSGPTAAYGTRFFPADCPGRGGHFDGSVLRPFPL